jgi:hypothetical protein
MESSSLSQDPTKYRPRCRQCADLQGFLAVGFIYGLSTACGPLPTADRPLRNVVFCGSLSSFCSPRSVRSIFSGSYPPPDHHQHGTVCEAMVVILGVGRAINVLYKYVGHLPRGPRHLPRRGPFYYSPEPVEDECSPRASWPPTRPAGTSSAST